MPKVQPLRVLVGAWRSGLSETGGEWALIHSRNLALVNLGCEISMWCGGLPEVNGATDHLGTAGYPTVVRNSSQATARLFGQALGAEALRTNSDAIVVSGDRLLPGVLRRTRGKIPVVVDVHGSIREGWEYGGSVRRFVTYPTKAVITRIWYRNVDAALVVTSELGGEVRRMAPKLNAFVVPCSSLYRPSWGGLLEDRKRWRFILGIADEDLVLVHSGGLGMYQHPDAMFRALVQVLDAGIPARLLLATRKVALARQCLASQPEFVQRRTFVDDFPTGLHKQVLAAADAGLLLREPNRTNRAAFPNKVDEYWSSGLPVVTTPALRSVADLIGTTPPLGLVLRGQGGRFGERDIGSLRDILAGGVRGREQRFHAIAAARERISFEITLQPFLDYLRRARAVRDRGVLG